MTQRTDAVPPRDPDDRGLHDLAEDAMGFGMGELRTAWAMLVRPRVSLDAYMRLGPTAGGTLARPLRLYLALNAIMMLVMFLQGGMESMMAGSIPTEAWQSLADQAGKSVEEFMGDAEAWISLALVPLGSAGYALLLAPFMRWWDPDDLGWRKGFRATFIYLNVVSVPYIPITLLFFLDQRLYAWSMLYFLVLIVYGFLRAGRGRWFSSWFIGAVKACVLMAVILVAQILITLPLMAIGYLGGTYGA